MNWLIWSDKVSSVVDQELRGSLRSQGHEQVLIAVIVEIGPGTAVLIAGGKLLPYVHGVVSVLKSPVAEIQVKTARPAMVADEQIRQPIAVVVAPGSPVCLAGVVDSGPGGDVGELNIR